MPAVIQIVSGSVPVQSHWIEEPVLRIGSDQACDVRIEGPRCPGHVATVEYRDRSYYLHNSGSDSLSLNGRPVAGGSRTVWKPNWELALPDDLVVVLKVQGDPAPSPRPAPKQQPRVDEEEIAETIEEVPAQKAETTTSSRGKTMFQLGVIAVCGIGVVVMLVLRNADLGGQQQETVSFDELDQQVEAAVNNGALPAYLLEYLRQAQVYATAGDRNLAKTWFTRLRDELLDRKARAPRVGDPRPKEIAELEANMLDYTAQSLSALNQ